MKYEFSGRIRYSEIAENGRLSIPGLVNYFQDVSTFQSEDIGVGMGYLQERHMAWILSFWQIVIERLPLLGETVTAQTWPYEFKGFFGLRNFTLLDQERQMLAKANSVWVLFDTEKQRPGKPEPEMKERYELEEKLDMEYAPRKLAVPESGVREEPVYIDRHHLDTNHHVNNGQYIVIAAAYLPEGFAIHQMKAEYCMQARLHDEIIPRVCREDGRVTVALENAQGKPYAVVEFDA